MKIEEAIQQARFQDEWHKATVNLIFTHNWVLSRIKASLKDHGITVQQYNVLRILRGQHPKPISTASIRERMLDKMSDCSRIVDRLLKKELVIRKTCPTDKRLVDVQISDQGLKLLATVDKQNHQLKTLLQTLDESEAQTLNHLLDKIREEG